MQTLINIRRSEVPVYLQDSELYLSLDDANDDEISVPSDCFKRDTSVNNLSELDNLLSTVRFWITSPLRIELMNYVVDRRVPGVKDVVAKYRVNFPTLFLVVSELHRSRSKFVCNIAAKHGSIEFLKYFAERKKPLVVQTFNIAAENGHVDCLSYCLDHLTRNNIKIFPNNLDWSELVALGHVDCLMFLIQRGLHCSLNLSCTAAANGQLACLRYLLSVRPVRSSELFLAAIEHDQLDCLKCIVEQAGGCEVTLQVWEAAMRPACHSDSDCETASDMDASKNEMEDESNEDGAGSSEQETGLNASSVAFRCLSYLLDTVPPQDGSFNLVNIACESNNVAVLQLLHQRGYSLTDATILYAAKCGSRECLQYLHQKTELDCWVPATMAAAASAGQLELVKQLHELGCPWDESAPTAALQAEQRDCLKYLIELRGLPKSTIFKSVKVLHSCWRVIFDYEQQQRDKEWKQYIKERDETILRRANLNALRIARCVDSVLTVATTPYSFIPAKDSAVDNSWTVPSSPFTLSDRVNIFAGAKAMTMPCYATPTEMSDYEQRNLPVPNKSQTIPVQTQLSLHDAAKALRSALDIDLDEQNPFAYDNPTGVSSLFTEDVVTVKPASDDKSTVLGRLLDTVLEDEKYFRQIRMMESLDAQNKHEKLMSMYPCIFTAPGMEQEDW